MSESTAESEEEREMELADLGATGVRDRDPPATNLPGDAYQTPPAGAGAGAEGAQAEGPPSPVSLAPGGLATTGDDLSGADVEGVDLQKLQSPLRPQILAQAQCIHRQWRCLAIRGWNSLIALRPPTHTRWIQTPLMLRH